MWTVQEHLDRLKPYQLKAWLKERLADEMPLLCIRLEETTAQSLIKWYKKAAQGFIRTSVRLTCAELAREFLSAPEAASDYYAGELLDLAREIDADIGTEAHALVAQSTFAALSKDKQVGMLRIIRKQPHDFSYWTELDQRTGGKLRNQIASCILDRGLSEFIQFMPRLTDDEPLGSDILTILLQVRIRHSADKELLLQMVREVLPTCCESIKLAVGEWFEEEGILLCADGSHVSFAAGMGAMCGAEDAKPVYDASVSLTHADGREIGCAKCREMFVAEAKRGRR